MKRRIVHIGEHKCNGCGLCLDACHEGALELVDGKARLVTDEYCDGLGDCLPECPTGAIDIVEREAEPFDEELVNRRIAERKSEEQERLSPPCGCPSARPGRIERTDDPGQDGKGVSRLGQWPVQLSLVNVQASYFQGADLLVAADCAAYAYGSFHDEFLAGRAVVIGCPKLDDVELYRRKLADIIAGSDLSSITVVKMEVPCCNGIPRIVKAAMLAVGVIVPYQEVTIGTDGSVT